MEEKPDKKKESIDEILSDLNGLLNKMPSILDGIKMPEMQPMELPRAAQPAPEKEPLPEAAPERQLPAGEPPAEAGEKTVVLQPFAGLEEGAPVPAAAQPEPLPSPEAEPLPAPAPEPASFDADKTVVLEAFSGLPEGSPAPAPVPEKLEPQSLGDFMFGENAGDKSNQEPELKKEEQEPVPAPSAEPETALPGLPEPAPDAMVFDRGEQPEPAAALPPFENTRDFGIPDIDALLQLSDSEKAAQEQPAGRLPEAGVLPESVQAIEESKDAVSIQGLGEAAPQPEAAGEGLVNFGEPKEEITEPAPQAADAQPQEPAAESQPAAEPSPFDAFAIEPSAADVPPAQEVQPAPEAAPAPAAEGLTLEPAVEMPSAQAPEEAAAPADAAAPLQGGETLKFESAAETAAQEPGFGALPDFGQAPAGAAAPEAGGIGLAPGIELGGQPQAGAPEAAAPGGAGLELSVGRPADAAEQTTPGGAGLELSVGRPADAADQTMPGGSGMVLGGSGDATLVSPPPGQASGDEERTVIFQAGAPSSTSRAQAGDLTDLAAKQPPEGIPPERIRTLMFLYAADDKALCATVLAELDAICLKSAVKPMFVKRAAVKECDPDANPNFIQQSVTEAGAQGLICLGTVPQDKVYELENTFGSSGGFFRYYDSSTFSHSAALDLVTDLILR